VFQLYKLFATSEFQKTLAERYCAGGMGYGEAKETLYQAAIAHLGEAFERRTQFGGVAGCRGRHSSRRRSSSTREGAGSSGTSSFSVRSAGEACLNRTARHSGIFPGLRENANPSCSPDRQRAESGMGRVFPLSFRQWRLRRHRTVNPLLVESVGSVPKRA